MKRKAKISAKPLNVEAASRLREMIRTGKLKKGERVVEAELCEVLGISRTPLREALRLLSSEGLIRLVPNVGAYVGEPSLDEIRDMFQVMAVLEGMCARLAAMKMTPASLKRLEALHEKLEKLFRDGDREGYIAVNNLYHTLVQSLAGNKVLSDTINGLRDKILLYRYRQIFEEKRFEESINEHREILDAFRKGDPQNAEKVMANHLLMQGAALVGSAGEKSPKGEGSKKRPAIK